ncbi:MAG: DUF354 domain-containing protein [Dehalococcoidales bacterium]|nr:DUF354 domain-containing protein [Dehalococcoidales bacterium]
MGAPFRKILFIINTPGQAYTWRYCISRLKEHGHTVDIIARNIGPTLKILSSFGFNYVPFNPIAVKYLRSLELITHVFKGLQVYPATHPEIIIGFGIDAAMLARVSNRRSIIFMDGEHTRFQNRLTSWFASTIITPDCFQVNLGKNHLKIKGYKELAYLHPNYFKPDPAVLDELQVNRGEDYVIVRFNSLSALHDVGRKGYSLADKYRLVRELEKHARVFISAEGTLPDDLSKYKLKLAPYRIHHALYYAKMFVSDTGTMNTESAVLGTQGILCFSRPHEFGNFVELENKYGLVYCFDNPQLAINKALELVQQPDLKDRCVRKRQQLLQDKIDVTGFMVEFIENYPISKRVVAKGEKK